jgi:hypothetical protein
MEIQERLSMSKQSILAIALAVFTVTGVRADSDDTTPPSPTTANEGLSRWFELDAASFSIRYRNSFDTDGQHIFDNAQQRSLLAGKLKLDRDGKYFIGFRAASGRYFNWSYANFSGLDYGSAANKAFLFETPQKQFELIASAGADPQSAALTSHLQANGWEFYIRDLYLSATPVTGLTFEFGAIPIERGVGSEITTYDEDGYISGERVRAKYPKQLFLDQIEFTSAYVGDIITPNFLTATTVYRSGITTRFWERRISGNA